MNSFVIQGGKKLHGEIPVRGAKNAAGPILAATTLIEGKCVLHNVPRISDIEQMISILQSMGARVTWKNDHSLAVDCSHLDPTSIDKQCVGRIRLSLLFLGCLAHRFGTITIPIPGGCTIGSRPVDAHFDALRDLGFSCTITDEMYTIAKGRLPAESITMKEFSVTATENAILASVLQKGSVTIQCCAAEHVVQDLCWFLESAGARIEGIGTHTLHIKGAATLHPVEYTIMPDPIETGTFIALAAATHSQLIIRDTAPEFLAIVLKKFEEIGLHYRMETTGHDSLDHYTYASLHISKIRSIQPIKKLHCMPYPGFAADLIQPFSLLMTQAEGISLIHDWMFDGRLRYVSELQKMGANITVLDPHRILIVGPTPLYGKEISSYDLRAGATLVVAGLLASGTTTIHGIDQVDRGYEALDERLRNLGAEIART